MTKTDPVAVTTTLYDALSGPPGQCDWPSFCNLFRPGARLIRINQPIADNKPHGRVHIMSVDEYVLDVDERIRDFEFEEREVAHDCWVTGDTAAVRSAYEARLQKDGYALSWGGVNFLQLIQDPAGWRIISIMWDAHAAPTR